MTFKKFSKKFCWSERAQCISKELSIYRGHNSICLQGRLAALELTGKRAAVHQAKDLYDHEVARALPLVSEGNEAAEKSVVLNEIVASKVT